MKEVSQLNPSEFVSPHSVASFVKFWVNACPHSILTAEFSPKFVSAEEIEDDALRFSRIQTLIYLLPENNRLMLDLLLSFIHSIKDTHTDKEYMIGVCAVLAPCIVDNTVYLQNPQYKINNRGLKLMEILFTRYTEIFKNFYSPTIRFEKIKDSSTWQVTAGSLRELLLKLVDPNYASEKDGLGKKKTFLRKKFSAIFSSRKHFQIRTIWGCFLLATAIYALTWK